MASHSHVKSPVRKLRINFCEEIDMRVLPGVGRKAAEQMSEFRRLHGNITTENVLGIPDVKVSRQFLQMVDFTRNHDYSCVPCRTNSRTQEHRTNTYSAVSWDEQSPENTCTPARRPVYSLGAHRKSEGSPRARSSRKCYPVYPRERTSARRPAYSPGGTPARVVPVDSEYLVVSSRSPPKKPLAKRLSYSHEVTPARRPAYSPGGTPARRFDSSTESDQSYSPCPPRTRSSGRLRPAYPRKPTSARRPAYSPGGTPARRLSPLRRSTHSQSEYSGDDSPARRQSPLRRPTCSREGKSTKSRPVYPYRPRLFTFSSDDSSTDSQSDDSSDDSPIRRPCDYPPRGNLVRQKPSRAPEETSSSDSSTDEEELAQGENHYERFLLASQTPDENLFEWADRVMILAGKELKDTSESYRNRLSIRLFCLECVDREAGLYALYHHPETLYRALDLIIHYVRSCRRKPWQASEANLARDLSNKEQCIAECQSPIMKSPVCDSTKIQNSARSQASIKKSPVCDFRKEQNITPNQPSINKSPVCDPPNSTELPNTAGKKQKTFAQNRSSKKSKKAKVKKTRAKRTLSTDEHPSERLAVDKSLQKTV